MKPETRKLLQPYQATLSRYLKQGPKAGLLTARRLGRQAVALGLDTLDLALIHEQALIALTSRNDNGVTRPGTIRQAGRFFAEVILPMEETHRTARESNAQLSRLNQELRVRTKALSASNRERGRELTKRKAVEQALRKSEQQYRRLMEESRSLQEQLRLLTHRILSIQEEERKRISRELHDVIAQTLTGINNRLATMKAEATATTKSFTQNIARTQKLVQRSVDIVHRFAYDLRPAALDHLGLVPALHSFLKTYARETGLRVSLTAFPGLEHLGATKRIALYRIAQEALTNVARHAQAERVDVRIRRLPGNLEMEIKNDGIAFDTAQALSAVKRRRMGLVGMRERAEMVGGHFSIASTPGDGTRVRARIPFNGARQEPQP